MKWDRGSRFCTCTKRPQLTVAPSQSQESRDNSRVPSSRFPQARDAKDLAIRSRDTCIGSRNLPRQRSTSPIVAFCPAFCIAIARDTHYSLLS